MEFELEVAVVGMAVEVMVVEEVEDLVEITMEEIGGQEEAVRELHPTPKGADGQITVCLSQVRCNFLKFLSKRDEYFAFIY